jgi:DNA-binding GntR family transcriptional regulator
MVEATGTSAEPRLGSPQTHARGAREWIRNAIVKGELEEGRLVSQVQLSREIGVSRTPLREAMRMLEAEGWLESQPNGTMRVARVSPAELEQFYAMRVALESLAITLAVPRLSEADLSLARGMLAESGELLASEAYDEWEQLNRQFHSLLISPAGDSILQSCQGLIDAGWRYRKVYVLAQPLAFVHAETDHRLILDACEERDAPRAAAALARHLTRTALTLLAAADPGHDPVTVRTAMLMVVGNQSL